MKKVLKIVLSGLFIALSIVLTRVFSAHVIIAGVPGARLAIGFVPIILASVILGPYFGMMVGAASDIIGFMLFPIGIYFPPITLTSALVGLLPYLIFRVLGKRKEWIRILSAVFVTQVSCSMFLQTLWISLLYNVPYQELFYPRALITAITIPAYYLFISIVLVGLKKANLITLDFKKPRLADSRQQV